MTRWDRRVRALAGTGLLMAGLTRIAMAQESGVRIGLTYAPGTQPGLYLLPVRGAEADSIRRILIRDLEQGHRLTVIAPDSGGIPLTSRPNYPLFAKLGAAGVLQLIVQPDGSVVATLHDVMAAQVRETRRFPVPAPRLSPEWRLAVHAIADQVELWVTGTRGVAATRFLFVRAGSLWQVDSDGANERPVPGVGSALGPAWHPNGRTIAYTVLGEEATYVVVRELATGQQRRVPSGFPLALSPAFTPDGTALAFAAGASGTDLFLATLEGLDAPLRLTVGRGSTNAQPTFSPDGRRLAFTTSRLGRNEIYLIDADGANPELLTSTVVGETPYRSDPAWSPDGRYVAFSTQIDGRFQVATVSLRDRTIRQYTTEGGNEDPSWAPDARHLVFTSSRTGTRQLWVLDTESGRVRQVTRGGAARMAAWSPRLVTTP